MNLFTIGDLHLSFASQKPMGIFGDQWDQHFIKIEQKWQKIVSKDDVVVIAGDISWAIDFDELVDDFRFIEKLNGNKIILKGNHDYWWNTMSKMQAFLKTNNFNTIKFLHNNAFKIGNIAICGTRGWFLDAITGTQQDQKVFNRELIRLETSLKAGKATKAEQIYAFLHYPPISTGYICQPIIDLLKEYGVKKCYYGHLHGQASKSARTGFAEGIEFALVSCDNTGFAPVLIDSNIII